MHLIKLIHPPLFWHIQLWPITVNVECTDWIDIKQRHISKDLVRVTNILTWNQRIDIWWGFLCIQIAGLLLLCVGSVLPVNICSIYLQFKNVEPKLFCQ